MQINLTGVHIEITDALRSYVEKKLEKIENHFSHIIKIDVKLIFDNKSVNTAEAIVKLPGTEIFAEAQDNDMYRAIDALTGKLDKQVIKHKEKLKNHNSDGLH